MRTAFLSLATVMATGAALSVALHSGATAAPKNQPTVELDEAAIAIEWHATDDELTLTCAWDADEYSTMRVSDVRGKAILDLKTKKRLKQQALAEGGFQSVDSESKGEEADEFFERFPAGTYSFKGKGEDGARLVGEAELTHVLPRPVENVFPKKNDEVSHLGFLAGFDPVTEDTNGNAIEIAFYVVVIEKDDDDPYLRKLEIVLGPDRTEVFIPGEFLEPECDYAIEVIAHEASGNRTVTEEGDFTTTPDNG